MENKGLFVFLMIIIITLCLILTYVLVLKPKLEKWEVENQVIGYEIAINQTLLQLQEQGYVQMKIGNQTLYLIPYNPETSK